MDGGICNRLNRESDKKLNPEITEYLRDIIEVIMNNLGELIL